MLYPGENAWIHSHNGRECLDGPSPNMDSRFIGHRNELRTNKQNKRKQSNKKWPTKKVS
jgi:hypothetical protein